ncbi:MAG: phosphoglucosamine mutase [Armatimonadota bacterium]|nr:phosphoglucosamine mutase [Armatimonadota bacterium]
MASDALFGTDGVRGVAGRDLSCDLARAVGCAWGAVIAEAGGGQVLMARDTRTSGPALASAAAEGLCAAGIDVIDCGVIPTGALCLLVSRSHAAGGVIISASHNPPEFNGVKLVGPSGHKLPWSRQERVEVLVREGEGAGAARPGRCRNDEAAGDRYLDLLFEGRSLRDLNGLRVVLDCAHGSAFELAPRALQQAGAAVETINADARGESINVGCGSTSPHAMAWAVAERGADLGVAFDGDADRAVFADHKAGIVDGDATKYVLATDLQDRGLLQPPLVVGTVMNNLGLERALSARDIELRRTPVGDRYVVEAMRETGALVGGEQSGHIIFPDTMIGDGIDTALRVCQVVARTGRPLAELAAPVVKIPQLLVNVPVANREAWRTDTAVAAEIERWEARLDDRARLLIRPSGTEPVVRIMVEADDEALAQEACEALAAVIAASG